MHTDDAEMQQVEIIGIVAIEDQQSNSLVRRVLPGLCVDTAGEEREDASVGCDNDVEMYQEENPADRLNALHKIETSQTTNEKVMNPPENVGQETTSERRENETEMCSEGRFAKVFYFKNIPFLSSSSCEDLKKSLNQVPDDFFNKYHSVLTSKCIMMYRKGETRALVENIEKHLNCLDEIIDKVRSREIPLNQVSNLKNPKVLNYLKRVGLKEDDFIAFHRDYDRVVREYQLYNGIYYTFSQLAIPGEQEAVAGPSSAVVEEKGHFLDISELKAHLSNIDPERSGFTLSTALAILKPLLSTEKQEILWFNKVKDSPLFIEKILQPFVVRGLSFRLRRQNLSHYVRIWASQWLQLAIDVAGGLVNFQDMEQIVKLEPDATALSQIHLDTGNSHLNNLGRLLQVPDSYRDFKCLLEIRHLIAPFVSALRLFSIMEKEPIDELYNIISNVVSNWHSTTLVQVRDTGIIKFIEEMNSDLQIDPERPETRKSFEFTGISSLVTLDGNSASDLIDWLLNKNEQDMKAMGKILQGTLLEAFGQLQTLKTSLAPYLNKKFMTYQELLRAVQESEQHFSESLSNCVQSIKCKWLVKMLPEIDAAIRASVITPSEDAKTKLIRLGYVVINSNKNSYSIEIKSKPLDWFYLEEMPNDRDLFFEDSLSLEELQQAFQLLDMAVMDNVNPDGDLITVAKKNCSLILQLSNVFGALFATGCTPYSFQERKTIELYRLEDEIANMQNKLDEWNSLWKKVEEFPLLRVFSRSYLLHLADLVARSSRQDQTDEIVAILRMLLPSASQKLQELVAKLLEGTSLVVDVDDWWLSTEQLFDILRQLQEILQICFYETVFEVDLPVFLKSYSQNLRSHFIDKAVVLLNVTRELLVGSSLAAYVAFTGHSIEPTRILFVTKNTEKEEVERFMKLWSVADVNDIFVIVHIERLSSAGANAICDGVGHVLPERRTRLLLLAQHQSRVNATKSLGARLGLVSDRMLEINFTSDQLREFFLTVVPNAAKMHFYTSKLPGCGKSQQVLHQAALGPDTPDYYRIPVRLGTVEELLANLKKMENLSGSDRKQAVFLHFDVAHSTSIEFNDILLSLLIHGALYDPKNSKLGFWTISPKTKIAIEFASPFGVKEFPIISYIGVHCVCECLQDSLSYDLAVLPHIIGQKVTIKPNDALIAAGNFLQLKRAFDTGNVEGIEQWNLFCDRPDIIIENLLSKDLTFQLLVDSFRLMENRQVPTFTALNAMASFLHRHVRALCVWFNTSAKFMFDNNQMANDFKSNIFNLLLSVADDCVSRCWSVVNKNLRQAEMDWNQRQRVMFFLGLDDKDQVIGINIVGKNKQALQNMFHPTLLPVLELQSFQFHQELRGLNNLLTSYEDTQSVLNAVRSLLLLDGTSISTAKVYQMDSYPNNTPAINILQQLIGKDLGYVLTGDNITKMMFALYRIRCGLPVIIFGEAGVGKSALFRFLIQSLLGHHYEVCNVNSGTSIQDIETMIDKAMTIIARNEESQVFLFLDEMNTADPPVIAFLKELMLDRHCHGTVLPKNLYLMAAANPYRHLLESDKEAAVGLAFRFAQSAHGPPQSQDTRNLVYRVNELPLSFYDHVYDFGHLCEEAENTYIEEICKYTLSRYSEDWIKYFASVVKQSHKIARAMSADPPSAVSLRDATRAAQLFRWFAETPAGKQMTTLGRVAVDITIHLVYAFRFHDREMFIKNVFGGEETASKHMKEVSKKIAKMLYDEAHGAFIGNGAIALNDALCENLFALYVCVLNGIFLIIVGRPGSSKSLSVEILKRALSPGHHELRQKLGDLHALTELYFQCSPLSTSSGFKALFESAANLSIDPKTMLAMVVLDELGLADLSPEKPIKVLHSKLDRRATLTSGEQQLSPYSVVALSNRIVNAAQVNRGILISRKQENEKEDLTASAKELAHSIVAKYEFNVTNTKQRIEPMLVNYLTLIVEAYQEVDRREDIGGGHFFSIRDFFYCVKSFVCSIFEQAQTESFDHRNLHIGNEYLIRSTLRNLGGLEQAQNIVRICLAEGLNINKADIPSISPLDLIVENIQDSSKEMSVHIARHLMILNRSLIGLQLLNRQVRNRLDGGLSWNVLFGSCFPGDLQVMTVTRKLRQVEQAIRSGGVLILCHADQLFESLYMVLNQQYWAQGDVTMTQIALGPSIRAIALPDGPFRIIALQDTDVALNRSAMSPAILSRFEKHELKPSHLLDDAGRTWLNVIESHPIWIASSNVIKRKKLLYGYHDESLASLALHLQTNRSGEPMLVDGAQVEDVNDIWMRALNPMAMIKLERDSRHNPEVLELCQLYRRDYILEGIDGVMSNVKSNRVIIMTSSLRHLEVLPCDATPDSHLLIRLFDIQTEMELNTLLQSVQAKHTKNKHFCLVVQYDATTGPIEQFQLTKYEIDTRLNEAECRVIFIVHVDPQPVGMHWIFSFGDGWEYAFVDEIVPEKQMGDHNRIPLGDFVHSPSDMQISEFIRPMPNDWFKSLLLEMLGPCLQASLSNLRSSLGPFYSGVRTSLGLPGNDRLIELLKGCLLAQLDDNNTVWNIVDAVSDQNFDSSSSLTEGLWGIFKNKISNCLAHLLLVSDLWRVSNKITMSLWCDFIEANFPEKIMFHATDSLIQMPVGFRFCQQPFGRLLNSFDEKYAQNSHSPFNRPLRWLIDHIKQRHLGENSFAMQEIYFRDWLLLRIPLHLHTIVEQLPLAKVKTIVSALFEDTENFVEDWKCHEANVIAAFELLSIASYVKADTVIWFDDTTIQNWGEFTETAVRLSLAELSTQTVLQSQKKFLQSITLIETSSSLQNLLEKVEDLSQLWLGLRIAKFMLLLYPSYNVQLAELKGFSAAQIIENLTEFAIECVILSKNAFSRQSIRTDDLYNLFESTATCTSPKDLAKILRRCPNTKMFVLEDDNAVEGKCSSCRHPLMTKVAVQLPYNSHDISEENGMKGGSADEENRTRCVRVQHLSEQNTESLAVAESLIEGHQKFLFFFERVAELLIQQCKKRSKDVQDFLRHLIKDARLCVSWRIFTVIVRIALSTETGSTAINDLISNINCNRPSKLLRTNILNFLRALLACADEDARLFEGGEEANLNFIDATMTREWTVQRIRRLALIRKRLADRDQGVSLKAIEEWTRSRRNNISEAFLFFVLRFASGEGDETQLYAMLHNPLISDELKNQHPIISPYRRILSPVALGFDLKPKGGNASRVNELLKNGPNINDICVLYPILQEKSPEWAPFIARLAFHATDVAESGQISILETLATDLNAASQCFLPGINDHSLLADFNLDRRRWYVCTCGTLCFVGNCGKPTPHSICTSCSTALAVQDHVARPGVRHATLHDFLPPKGWHTHRKPSGTTPLEGRNVVPHVTRFALLLNSLTLMNAALNPQTDSNSIIQLMRTLKDQNPTDLQDDRHSFVFVLSEHVLDHLRMLSELLVTKRQLTIPDQFRLAHVLLHKLLDYKHPDLRVSSVEFAQTAQAREIFERILTGFLVQQRNLDKELNALAKKLGRTSAKFRQSLVSNESLYWIYARRVFADRQSVQLEFAREPELCSEFPFLNLLLDDRNWGPKLNALCYLGEAMLFISLVRSVLQGNVTREEAGRMNIGQGLGKIIEAVSQKAVLLDRGRPVSSGDQVNQLFRGLKQLWDSFSQIANSDQKTFLDHFECQEIDVSVRPRTILEEDAPLILILAGNDLPETTFVCQLLAHATETASSVSRIDFVQPYCRLGSSRVRLSCSSTTVMADFDESLYAHVATEVVDRFISDHFIDKNTLRFAESFAATSVLGSAGSTIAQDLVMEAIPEFKFKDNAECGNYLLTLERRSLAWKPTAINPEVQDKIIADLERNRCLNEAQEALVCAIAHLQANTEPLVISKVRDSFIVDVFQELKRDGILTERHFSNGTLSILNRYFKLQVRHIFELLKGICSRMNDDDIFSGRVPPRWGVMMPDRLTQLTLRKMQSQRGTIMDTLLQMAHIVSSPANAVPPNLQPDQSLLLAIRLMEDDEWDGVPVELKMENLGHVLLLAESIK